jgi:serine/threonine protein kinase
MSLDHTQRQSTEDARRAQELSLQHARPPVELPGYEAQRLLGRGAYGEVWVATDRNTGRRVAIKFYTHRGGIDWTLLSREVEKLAYLSADRYVVQLLEVGWSANPPYYVMEYVENGSLDDYLRQHGRLNVAEAVEIFREIAVGLNHAHGKGVLHCDLKPGNILLDQDHKPRLADFGQSRLSHEQKPALGTLFYMAPEQADLDAVPDARWDVYALGAILYRMLTGEPPSRTEAATRDIEQAVDLPDRLARYRHHLAHSPPPSAHRRTRGVDRALSEIIDRCLAVDPERRFANVQEIVDALSARAEARTRRPLMLLGFVGPMLLLLIMALSGLRGYEHAVRDSENAIRERARLGNEFAAKFAARSIEGEIAKYFRTIRLEADDPEFQQAFLRVAESPIVKELNDSKNSTEIERLVEQFLADPVRVELNHYLERRLQSYLKRSQSDTRELKLASILVLDAKGRMLAVAYDTDVRTKSVGWNHAYRSYFHGGPADLDLPRDTTPTNVWPITQTRLSAAFRSSSTGIWKVGVSAPIYGPGDDQQVRGVIALTVSLGDFAYFRSNNSPDRFAALLDGRPGPNFGVILQHPLLDRLNLDQGLVEEDFTATKYRVTSAQLERIRQDDSYLYKDPLSAARGGETYAGDWIAAIDQVRLPSGTEESEDMIVLVQERYEEATEPVKQLGRRLKGEGLWALGGVAGVIVVLWYIVLRLLSEPRIARRPAPRTDAQPLPTLTTAPTHTDENT